MRIREDVWEGGKIVASRPTDIEVEITKIEFFPSFIKMLETVGTERVSPKSGIPEEAISEYRRFYTEEDEKKFGVIAFHFSLL